MRRSNPNTYAASTVLRKFYFYLFFFEPCLNYNGSLCKIKAEVVYFQVDTLQTFIENEIAKKVEKERLKSDRMRRKDGSKKRTLEEEMDEDTKIEETRSTNYNYSGSRLMWSRLMLSAAASTVFVSWYLIETRWTNYWTYVSLILPNYKTKFFL